MKKLSSWLLTIFIIMFWVFRLIVAFTFNMGINFPFKPLDFNVELILLFITLFSILLIVKRNFFGGMIYVIANVYYFGAYAYSFVSTSGTSINLETMPDLFVATIALILSFGILIDLALNKDRHEGKDNKDTYWFYKNDKYERQLDERADKNQYRIK